jgi:hypothetical protein
MVKFQLKKIMTLNVITDSVNVIKPIYSRYLLYEYSYNKLAKTSTHYMNIRYMNF